MCIANVSDILQKGKGHSLRSNVTSSEFVQAPYLLNNWSNTENISHMFDSVSSLHSMYAKEGFGHTLVILNEKTLDPSGLTVEFFSCMYC